MSRGQAEPQGSVAIAEKVATTPAWLSLQDAAKLAKQAPNVDWAKPSCLPKLAPLGDQQLLAVLAALRQSKLEQSHPLIGDLKANLDGHDLARFAWVLCDGWLASGAPPIHKWALVAQGLVGNDFTVMKLAPLVRAWPGERQHQRAKLGLQCLRAIGTDTALMELQAIARKLKFKALQARAQEFITAIAQEKGLTEDQLEDRVVPDCGLDARGSRLFDYGVRQFRLALGPQLKPMIRDEAGRLKPGLPRPGAKDDPEKSARALHEWQLMKKQLGQVLKLQTDRLKKAMVHQRRWSVVEFEKLLVRHPLMTNLARLLVWGGYDAAGKLQSTFRVTEEQVYENVQERPVSLEGAAAVGVVHPYHLPEEARRDWAELFSDYEVMQPFPQLGRPVYQLEPHEVDDTQLRRLEGIKVAGASLVFHLENLGWSRGHSSEQIKQFPSAGVTAVIRYQPGVWAGPPSDWPDQQVTHCFFEAGLLDWSKPSRPENALQLGTVDPLAVTEVLNDLVSLGKHAR